MRIAITAAAVTCAAGRSLVPPDRCWARPDADAQVLGIYGVARAEAADDARFPDDRKGALAASALAGLVPSAPGERDGRSGRAGRRAGGQDSGQDSGHGSARVGIFLGTGLSSLTPDELQADLYPHIERELGVGSARFDRDAMSRDLASDRPSPRRHQPERVTEVLGAQIGASVRETSFSACAAAAQSILQAARAVHRGDVDVAYAGGHDSMLHPIGYLSFVVLGALSPTVGRPFDRHRDGFMIGEGAAILRLQREQDLSRDDRVLAWIVGGGTSVDAYNVTHPHPEGLGAGLAMRRALRDAQLDPGDIDYVNAHGTGTPVGDRAECLAVHQVLGDVPVSSFKGAVGHTIAAAGAVELALCLGIFGSGLLPGTPGLEEIDPELPARVLRAPIPGRARHILSNSFGFGGQNCALILAAP